MLLRRAVASKALNGCAAQLAPGRRLCARVVKCEKRAPGTATARGRRIKLRPYPHVMSRRAAARVTFISARFVLRFPLLHALREAIQTARYS